MFRSLKLIVCAFMVGMSAGCIPESDNPITPLADATQDSTLSGVWSVTDEESVRYLHIGAETDKGVTTDEAEPGLMRLWFMTHRKAEHGVGLEKPFSMRFFVSQVGDHHFANGILPFEDTPGVPSAEPVKFYLMRYKVDGDRLTLSGINFEAVAAAIESGELGGTVKRDGKELKSVHLTDSSEHLRDYLGGAGADKLFPEKGQTVFRRVR
jgi:hypothetical protein